MSTPPGERLKSMSRGGKQGEMIPKGYRTFQFENMDPETKKLFYERIKELGPDSYLARLASGDESFWDELEAPAMRQFSELQGGLASRFSGMGTGGRKSSGFQNTATAAGSNFAQDLQSQRMQLRNQAIKDLHGMSIDLMGQKPYERGLVEKQHRRPSGMQAAAPGLIQAGGTALGAYFGGPPGAAAGNKAAQYATQGM
jgi:hypothetical protein